MAVEVDPYAGPVEARGDLFDVGRLARAVIAADEHTAVAREAGEDGERRVPVEQIVGIEVGNMLLDRRVSRDFEIAVDPKDLANGASSCRATVLDLRHSQS